MSLMPHVVDMSDQTDWEIENPILHCGDQDIPFTIEIKTSLKVCIHFLYLGRQYMFEITRWRCKPRRLEKLFHLAATRDHDRFGRYLPTEDHLEISSQQRIQLIFQAARDIVQCLNLIKNRHASEAPDYASWYHNHHSEEKNGLHQPGQPNAYGKFITDITCECMVKHHFMKHSGGFPLFEFQP